MKSRVISALQLVCAAGVIACNARDQITEPVPLPLPLPAPGELQFASIRLTPSIAGLVEGDTVRLKAVPVDTRGSEIPAPYTVAYASAAPSVATVNEAGLVTAIAGGFADISATIVIGSTSKRTSVRSYVFATVSPDAILLTSGKNGWEPSQAQVTPGGTVQWRIGAIDWAGVPVTQVYLMNDGYGVVDSVDVRTGSATRRFESPGLVRYCSGVCWDPPDWGVIYVR